MKPSHFIDSLRLAATLVAWLALIAGSITFFLPSSTQLGATRETPNGIAMALGCLLPIALAVIPKKRLASGAVTAVGVAADRWAILCVKALIAFLLLAFTSQVLRGQLSL